MRRSQLACLFALALVSAACSGPTEGGGDAAPAPSTTAATDLSDAAVLAAGGHAPDTTVPDTQSAFTAPARSATRPPGPAGHAAEPTGISTTSTTSHRSVTQTTAVAMPPGLPPEKCPEPKTCRHFQKQPVAPRYPVGPDGRVTVEYWFNPTGLDTSTISAEEAEGAVAAAFAAWQRANPRLHVVYRGRTTRSAVPGDGVNVVAFHGRAEANFQGDEFDMTFVPVGWMWAPCEQRDGACTPLKRSPPTGTGDLSELQNTATHEAGHALGLGHVADPELDRLMTMNGFTGINGDRFLSTLALGDVLGVRALYPCDCPLPPIYDP